MSSLRSINALTLATRDMVSSCAFYTRLGLHRTYFADGFATFSASAPVTPANNDLHINLFHSPAYVPPPPGRWNQWGRCIFFVADVDTFHGAAVEAGLAPEFEPRDAVWGERYFHILDPNGHQLAFAQPLYDHPRWHPPAPQHQQPRL